MRDKLLQARGGSGGGWMVFGGNRSRRFNMSREGGGGRGAVEKEGNKDRQQNAVDE